ncbi:MAG: HAMP domain-containing histidine kinase [Desulfobacter sp.]|nr:MAG: HAMP domain-containing histidine kinase [Desulfobacter sp.]
MLQRITQDIPASVEAARAVGTNLEAIRTFMSDRGITRQLESIHHAGVRASQIVQNMLSFSRKDYAGKSFHDISDILDLSVELAKSDYDLKKKYDFKRIEIERVYDQDLPRVSCEASKIQQFFFNILKNCAEAIQEIRTDEDRPAPKLILRIFKGQSEVVVEIQDNGPGMEEGGRKRIFEPFYTTKPVGKGARFIIHLPAA